MPSLYPWVNALTAVTTKGCPALACVGRGHVGTLRPQHTLNIFLSPFANQLLLMCSQTLMRPPSAWGPMKVPGLTTLLELPCCFCQTRFDRTLSGSIYMTWIYSPIHRPQFHSQRLTNSKLTSCHTALNRFSLIIRETQPSMPHNE